MIVLKGMDVYEYATFLKLSKCERQFDFNMIWLLFKKNIKSDILTFYCFLKKCSNIHWLSFTTRVIKS